PVEMRDGRVLMSPFAVSPVINLPIVNNPPALNLPIVNNPSQPITNIPIHPIVHTPPPNPLAAAQAVDLVTVPRQVLSEPLTMTTASHLYSFHLEQSDRIEIDVQTPANVHLTALLSILDSQGNVVATSSPAS